MNFSAPKPAAEAFRTNGVGLAGLQLELDLWRNEAFRTNSDTGKYPKPTAEHPSMPTVACNNDPSASFRPLSSSCHLPAAVTKNIELTAVHLRRRLAVETSCHIHCSSWSPRPLSDQTPTSISLAHRGTHHIIHRDCECVEHDSPSLGTQSSELP